MEAALEAGAEDVVSNDDGSVDVLTDPDSVRPKCATPSSPASWSPKRPRSPCAHPPASSSTPMTREQMVRLLETLEDLDDVQQVYSNADISEEILATLVSRTGSARLHRDRTHSRHRPRITHHRLRGRGRHRHQRAATWTAVA